MDFMRKFYLSVCALLSFFLAQSQTQQIVEFKVERNGFGRVTDNTFTWNVPCGVTQITVEVWGAGGAGDAGAGGGGGGYARTVITNNIQTQYNIGVGVGGSAFFGNADGGNSYFRIGSNFYIASATGGNAPTTNRGNVTPGTGGQGTVGGFKFDGGNGGNRYYYRGDYAGGGGGGSAFTNANGQPGQNAASTTTGGAGGTGTGNGGNGSDRTGNWGGDGAENGFEPGGGGGGRSSGFSYDGDGADGLVRITYVGPPSNYCTPRINRSRPITLVQFAGIDNPTSENLNSDEYEPFCLTGNVSQGGTEPITLKGNTNGNWTYYFTVFIDWNQDGDFDDAGERYNIGTITNSTGIDSKVLTGTIGVPATAKLGLTRMRVSKQIDEYVDDACSQIDYGQVEDYSILVSGGCVQPTSALANGTANNLTVCEGTSVNLTQSGGILGPNQSWKWYVGNPPSGGAINTNTNQDASYTVTPATTTTYYVRSEGGNCGTGGTGKYVIVTVVKKPTIGLTSGNSTQTVCAGTAVSGTQYTIGGGATGASIAWSPSTSITVNQSGNVFTLSGNAPAIAGTYNYTITTSGSNPCTDSKISGTITVNTAPSALSYGNTNFSFCSGGPITSLQPTLSGTGTITYSVLPALPSNLSIDPNTGIISGTPNAIQSSTAYTITATNSCGSTSKIINIAVSSGDQAFNVTPSGIQNICSDATGVSIGLSGSVIGNSYQLFRDGSAIGSAVSGTGGAIPFGTFNQAGVYTVRTTSACATNMNNSVTINVTPKPNVTFTYTSYAFCQSGIFPVATLNGSPLTGTFSANPAGLKFVSTSTGEIDLANSDPGTYTITYTVAAGGGCALYSYSQPNQIIISSAADIYSVTGGGKFCVGASGAPVGLQSSQTGVTYELYKDGAPLSPAQTISGNGNPISFGNQTTTGLYTIWATLGGCTQIMSGEAEVIANPVPENIKVVPATSTVCQGSVQSLTAIPASESEISSTKSVNTSTGSNIGNIPNNSDIGISSSLQITGIPAGATITGISVGFRIDHTNDADLVINLKGPNGNVLNIANGIGGTGNNYGSGNNSSVTYTIVNNTSTNSITTGFAPFTSGNPYAPQAAGGIDGATSVSENRSNVSTFEGLYDNTSESANGTWILSVKDSKSSNSGGTFRIWQIQITYTTVANPVDVTWSPDTDLFKDPGATVPYQSGNEVAKVFVKPSTPGSKTYTATVTNGFGCSVSATSTITVNPSPDLKVTANYCIVPGKVRITGTTTQNSTWIWSTGDVTGSSTSSYIDVDEAGKYYVSATSVGYSCAATAVMSIAQELVTNGNFEQGNTGFQTDYYYQPDVAGNNELVNDTNPVNNGYGVGTNGQNYHNDFWGIDHTYGTGAGNFMIVNGHGDLVVWKNLNVTVMPNTDYYFSAWAMSLNDKGNNAILKFVVDGDGTFTENVQATLNNGISNNSNKGWQRLYGKWTSGPSTTTINISIVNLNNTLLGNDFGLDDISFATLSTFFNLTSGDSTKEQLALCEDAPIADITYEVGGDGNPPVLVQGTIPAGLETYWNGRNYRIYGTPTVYGTFNFKLATSGCSVQTQEVTLQIAEPSNIGTITGGNLVSVCYGSSGFIPITGTIGNLNWETSTDKINWQSAPDSSYTNLQGTIYYRVSAQNTSACAKVTSDPITLTVKNLWIGKTNTTWDMKYNWSDSTVPLIANGCPNVVIGASQINLYPILNVTNDVSVDSMLVLPSASVTMNTGSILHVAGGIISTVAGGVDARKGAIEFNGVDQSVSGDVFKDKTLNDLIVSSGGTGLAVSGAVNDTLNITGKISFGNSTADLNSGDNITLKSTQDKTASLGEVSPGNTVNGKFTVERYINIGNQSEQHAKAWLFLATPTQGQTIRQSWMENGTTPTGYGINIPTYTGSGWDANTAYAPSIKSYDYQTDNWIGAANATDLLYNKNGWMVFVRGDRNVTLVNQPANNTNLRSKGTLLTGDQTFTVPAKANGFYAIGNPYASAVDMSKVDGIGTDGTFYVWVPTFSGLYSLGAYQAFTYDPNLHSYVPAVTNNPDSMNNYILSGQAIFVQTFDSPYDITFHENSKGDTSINTAFFRGQKTGSVKIGKLRTNLYTGNNGLLDGTLQFFSNDYSNTVNLQDGRKLLNSGLNLSLAVAKKLLSVERREPISSADTIFFTLSGTANGSYYFTFDATNLAAPGSEAWLEDAYTKQRTPVNVDGATKVSFVVNNDAASKAANRFHIVFKTTEAALPVTFVKVNAVYVSAQVDVNWTVANENNLSKYVVMKSIDGTNFKDIADVVATGLKDYAAIDMHPANGYNYYRIRSVDRDGSMAYSEIVKVWVGSSKPSIKVFPNPVVNGIINLRFENMPSGKYLIRLLNPSGQVILNSSLNFVGGNYNEKIPWNYQMAHGSYQLEITRPDGSVKTIIVMY